ncbi:Protein of unknown function [Thalassospira xiamenensis M-5 = DSM 17429]|uniref:Antitoxin Xre/MbcA/ParS-like toxin-binding domain-containing protein n=1 Tax=Thalassospira xiamenensis M-5 = DSM 17429 TaxID=1123366 RepID=A0AB72UL55_9PROT|nr:antitoxin Xre/MbcA/ParS toxin-binding domain-containing protein [Thalassospira xiamenensis]AJD54338.1 hypothetical protein TH3_21328 [Thalassospira xiamenensis M-5 = DSM 17429]SIT21287.1 Protein of unknown function [Thalassospira xiamenensis M-5 = DSM 17429]
MTSTEMLGYLEDNREKGFLQQAFEKNGVVRIEFLTTALHLTKKDIAPAVGLQRDAISKKNRLVSPRTQLRLSQLIQILNRVLPWMGSAPAAWAWYRSQELPGFGGQTAEQLVKSGNADAVINYLEEVAGGGYA